MEERPRERGRLIRHKFQPSKKLCGFIETLRLYRNIMAKGKVQKKGEKKLTSFSFMYVCVAGNGEMLVFFLFFPNNSLIDNSLSE